MADALVKRLRAWLVPLLRAFDRVHDRVRRHPVVGELYEAIDGVIGDYVRDHGPMYAGALAFYAMLSLIPFIVLFASVSGFVLAGASNDLDATLTQTVDQVRKVIPYLEPRFADDLKTIIANRTSLGAVGFVALLVSASEVFRGLEFALARIFARVDHGAVTDAKARPRNYLTSKLWFGAVVTATVLAYVALRLSAGILRHLAEVWHLPAGLSALLSDALAGGTMTGQLFTAVGIIVGFVVIVKAFTKTSVVLRYAVVGGVAFYLGFLAAHRVYDIYIQKLTNIGAMYGSFATLIVVVLWIYFSASLLLLCCHGVKTLQRRMVAGPRWPKDISTAQLLLSPFDVHASAQGTAHSPVGDSGASVDAVDTKLHCSTQNVDDTQDAP